MQYLTLLVNQSFLRSTACSNPGEPTLAEVAFAESPSFHSTFAIDLPPNFITEKLPERERFDNYRLRADHKSNRIWVWVRSWERRLVIDFDALAEHEKLVQAGRPATTRSPTERVTIRGVPALRWETEHKPRSIEPNATYLTTVLQGDSEVVVVTVWGLSRALGPLHDQMRQIAETGHWPTADETIQPAAGANVVGDRPQP